MSPLNNPLLVAWIGILIVVLTTVGSIGVAIGMMKAEIQGLRSLLEHHVEIDHRAGNPSNLAISPQIEDN